MCVCTCVLKYRNNTAVRVSTLGVLVGFGRRSFWAALGCWWQLLLLVCRHYEKEAKDKRIYAAHQATVFAVVGVFFFFGGFCFWAFHFSA